ncbi:hypothetical protein IP88_13545, partial [alpha proteobacterium AAP81b]
MDGAEARGNAGRVGAALAAARVARGLTLADIARDTRVPLRHLRAIEADEHEALPALTYAIGFVKAFATAVGLDPEATAAQFRGETSKLPHAPSPIEAFPDAARRLPSAGLVTASVVIVVGVIGALSAWGAGLFDPALPTTPAPIEAAAPELAPAGDGNALAADGNALAADGNALVTGDAPAAAAAPPVVPTTGAVVLTAREEVWVRIADPATRTTAKIGILAPGESFAVPADPPGLRLWTGKAGALAVTVGGRDLPPLGGPIERLRGLSLAAADLVARTAPPAAPPAAS